MKNHFYIILIFLFAIACKVSPKLTVSEADTFYKMYGGALDEKAYDVQETNDRGFLIAGSINILINDETTGGEIEKEVAYIAKADQFGNLQWQKQYPAQAIRALAKAPAGGWYLGADSAVVLGGQRYLNFALFKIDENGNVEWVRKYNNTARQEQVKSLLIDEDKGRVYLLGDFRPTLLSNDIRMLLIVTDLQGNFISTANFGTANPANNSASDGPNDVGNVIIDINSQNKNFLLCGTTLFQGDRNLDIRVTPLNADLLSPIGDYNNLFGSVGNDRGEQIINTRDRNAAIVGTVSGIGAGGRDIYAAKMNIERFGDGNWNSVRIEWEKTFGGGGNDEGKSICQADDGGYFLLGNVETVGSGLDMYLAKLDFLGNLQWEKQFGGTRNDQAKLVKQLSNGDVLILGTITFENNTMIALIRTDRNGNLVK
ncbi:MAG: lipoprotein [Raineya sp.]